MDLREILNTTGLPTLLSAIPNQQLVQASSEIKSLSRQLRRNATAALTSEEEVAAREREVKAHEDLSQLVGAFSEKAKKLRDDLSGAIDQIRILVRLKGRDASQLIAAASSRSSDPPNILQFLLPVAEAATDGWTRIIVQTQSAPLRELHSCVVETLGAVQRLMQAHADVRT